MARCYTATAISIAAFLALLAGLAPVVAEPGQPPKAPNTAPTQPLSVKDMHEDLAFLRAKIRDQHPHPWLYIRTEAFERIYRDIDKGLVAPMDHIAFYRRAAPLAASLRDGHTALDLLIDDFQTYAKAGGVLPLEGAFIDGRLYVTNNASGDPHLQPGTEILGINGETVADIVRDDRGLLNDVQPIYDVYARLLREMYWLNQGAPATFAITYRDSTGGQGLATVPAHVFPAEAFHSYQTAGSTYDLRMLTSKVGLLTVNSFAPSAEFETFLDQSFKTLGERHALGLIIDVRRNGGGSERFVKKLVSYFADRPYATIGGFEVKVTQDLKALYLEGTTHTDPDTKRIVLNNPVGALVDGLKDAGPVMVTPEPRANRFHGKVYVLTANNTFSAAAMFAAYVKCNHLGVLVGEAPGQATDFVADGVPLVMPHSGLGFTVSFSEIHMPCEQSYIAGIPPNYPIHPSPQALSNGNDPVLDFARTLASKDGATQK